jgi:ligand-binding SRPBCC domain-containing protein
VGRPAAGRGLGPLEEGSRIRYRLRVRGIPIGWTSLISRWDPPHAFVDEQVSGPYSTWIHEHTFEERDGGTVVRDRVDYDVPGGRLVERLFVRRDLERIFDHRKATLTTLLAS